MMLERDYLITVIGGANISGAILNALIRAVNAALEVGRSLGSSIRRGISGKKCSV